MLAEATVQSTIIHPPLQPLVRELPADLDTPTTAYLKLRGHGPSFLLESVEGGERIARYSFIGLRPRARYLLRGHTLIAEAAGETRPLPIPRNRDFLHVLQAELAQYPPIARDGLPRFLGGLVGYLGFETLRHFEPVLDPRLHRSALPDAVFLLTDTFVAFDHARSNLLLMTCDFDGNNAAAEARLDEIEALLRGPTPNLESSLITHPSSAFHSNLTRNDYEHMVRAAKEYIAAGDIFQVVLSQRFMRRSEAHPFNIYRAVRRLNPSPYMFYFEFGEVDGEPLYLVGASPEMMTRLEGRRAALRPIAGTRPRGRTPAEDAALERDLLADPKERAEHVMLVDLGRNDLGRVCEYGSIAVPDFFTVEHYSHVMHIVSHVTGKVRPGVTAFDLVRATFPAGTLSGAPKVRACEIIAELEPEARGPYGGAVGYFSFDGALDTCIAIRTASIHGRTVSVQAGAGIVADSDPAREYEETVNKAAAMMRAVELAEGSLPQRHGDTEKGG
jgi:anthranilate synthase component 1